MEIKYIPYKDINKKKWDECIGNALHPSLFCTSIYLDTIAGNWDGLIVNDYEIIMPLIFRKKLGIKYLYQPAFLPQIGIFCNSKIEADIYKNFIEKLISVFDFAEVSIASITTLSSFHKNMEVTLRNNYVVNLQKNYISIHKNYHPNFTKSLRRLQKFSLQYKTSNDSEEIIRLYKLLYLKKIASVKKTDLHHFLSLCLYMKKDIIIRKVYDANNNLIAGVILLRYKNIIYNIISCVTPAGKKTEANYFLYDKLMEEFSGQDYVLDLEGSDIVGIANFYLKMNPINEQYISIKYNNLPALIKLIKK